MARIRRYDLILNGKTERKKSKEWAEYFGISLNHFYNLYDDGKGVDALLRISHRRKHGWPCGWCNGTVPPGSHEKKKYCTDECALAAKRKAVARGVKKMLSKRGKGDHLPKIPQDNRSVECQSCTKYTECLDKFVFEGVAMPVIKKKCHTPEESVNSKLSSIIGEVGNSGRNVVTGTSHISPMQSIMR